MKLQVHSQGKFLDHTLQGKFLDHTLQNLKQYIMQCS